MGCNDFLTKPGIKKRPRINNKIIASILRMPNTLNGIFIFEQTQFCFTENCIYVTHGMLRVSKRK